MPFMTNDMNMHAFYTFWNFINERQRIYLKRLAGREWPWSEDPIFQEWKFCNVYRSQDRQSRFLIKAVIERNWVGTPYADMIFNIYAFRAFNLDSTFVSLTDNGSFIHNWDPVMALQILENRTREGRQLTSGAYMIRGREGIPKYESIVKTLTEVWWKRNYLLERMQDEPIDTMEGTYDLLMAQGFWGWGPFTTYQVLLDLTYTPILENAPDLNTWCEFGPGAKRGLNHIFPGIKTKEFITATQWLWKQQEDYLADNMKPMTLQDIEFALCELSKYLRIEAGGRSKERYAQPA